MTTLTKEQSEFIQKQGISLSQIFDATGLKKSQYQMQMDDLGMQVAIGVTPCQAAGHTMRSKAGHCVQCNTHHLAFQRRYMENGIVYIANSKELGLVKVGTSQNLESRIKNLRSYAYGGAKDWEVVYSVFISNAARFELDVQQALATSNVVRPYTKDGFRVDCQELFSCTPEVAIASLNKLTSTS
jgi:hypothetical protein